MGRRLLHCAGAALVAMSYNPMSMLSLGRQEDILAGALRRRAAVVLLQGTRWKATHPIEHWRCHGFEVFSCGYGTCSNRAAGVVVALHSSVFKMEHIHSVAYPTDPCLAGRAMGIRTVTKTRDYFWCAWYVPPDRQVWQHHCEGLCVDASTREPSAITCLACAWT